MPGTPSHKIGYLRNKLNYCRVGNESKRFEEPDDFEINKIDGAGTKHGQDEQDEKDCISNGEDDQMEVYGYRRNCLLNFLTWSLIILTGGILRLIFHWSPYWMLLATHVRCNLSKAEKVLVIERYLKHKCYHVKKIQVLTKESVKKLQAKEALGDEPLTEIITEKDHSLSIHIGNGIFKECDSIRMFTCKKLRYYWDGDKRMFRKLNGLDCDVTTADLHRQTGITAQEEITRRTVYGNNEIVIPVTGIMTLLFLEVLNPFYIFQLFSFCLWFADDYVYYAIAILLMSAFGVIMSIIQTRRNQRKLRSTVHSVDVVSVLRGRNKELCNITTEQLVPGDIMVVPSHGCVMHCDAVLLAGNCIVNESMLTGESVPVTKTPLPNLDDVAYDGKEHARHTLYCGTQIIQTRYYGDEYVYALVIRTGFTTSKGNLVRSIMYPPPVDFKFEHDSYKFVMLLAITASFGFIYTIITKHLRGISASEIAIEALDLITIAVPPALPAAMTVGRMYAQSRLQKRGIYCISPRSINVSGSIDCVCFDKTGTLTEDGLDMWGVVPIMDKSCRPPVRAVHTLEKDHLLYGMVTCHSLTIIDGKLSGDPLDLKMFESTNWILEEPDVSDNTKFEMVYPTVVKPKAENEHVSITHDVGDTVFPGGEEIGIVRQFPFTSALQRMSVITKKLGDKDFMAYCKGSPEMILSLSKPQSVPPNFMSVLQEYTEEGYRVLALAYKPLSKLSYAKVQRVQREEVEQGLTLLGFVILENRLKPETTGIIKELRDANIRTIMVTGDNMLTALSVARDCGIVASGQRVILVHSTQITANRPPVLYYTNSYCTLPTTISCNGDVSQTTNSTSVVSLDTLETGSVITDLEFSPTIESSISTDYSFAITGSTWATIRAYYPDLIPKMATRGAVFARMSPDQKQLLVQELQALGYYVAMCGDGANDCGALKAAHAGISLSDAESSVASPFTSKQPNISCVPSVIREGRAALVTSFGIFKYIAAYSLIQFISVMVLYSIDSNLTDIEFLFIDLFIITTFVFFFGKTKSYDGRLSNRPPLTSLISLSPVLSILLHMLLVIAIQVASFYHIQTEDWFIPYHELHEKFDGFNGSLPANESNLSGMGELSGYENYAVFTISALQYIILAVVFSKGKPYRESFFQNYGLLVSIIILTVFTIYLIVEPATWLRSLFELVTPPTYDFRGIVVAYGLLNFVASYFIEYFIIDFIVFKKLRYKFHDINKSKKKYLAIENKLKNDFAWPEISKDPIPELAPDILLRNEEKPIEKPQTEINETNFQRPNFEFGDLKSITEFERNRFWSHRQPQLEKASNGRIRRYSENSNQNAENEFLKMSVPNLSLNVIKSESREIIYTSTNFNKDDTTELKSVQSNLPS